jgi:GT2 family glycosyltransferase
VNKISSSGNDAVDFDRSWERLKHVGSVNYPPFLSRTLPVWVKDALRELRERMLGSYLTRRLPRNKEFEQSAEDAQASASMSIVVPVHDAPEVTKRCLMSLQKYAPKAEIFLVDDGSKLEETQKLLEDFSSRNGWKLIRHPEPLRHSAACRAGASLATRPYLCLLNSDTVVTPWCWRPLVQAFEDNPTIGVTGPSTSFSGNPQTMPDALLMRRYLNDSQICEYARRLLAENTGPILTDLPWAAGCAFFIRRGLWDQIGGFDRNIPDYMNETELCRRVLEAGYRAVWVRSAYIHHLGGVSYQKALGREAVDAHYRAAEDYIERKFGSGAP